MIKVKDTEAKMSVPKRTITVTGVSIEDGILVDESGEIVYLIEERLPEGVEVFDIKITVELPEEDEEVDIEDLTYDE